LAKIYKLQKKEIVELLVGKYYEETITAPNFTEGMIIRSLPNGKQKVRFNLGD